MLTLKAYANAVNDWMEATFEPYIIRSKRERSLRFLEEATELVQSLGLTRDDAHNIVEHVYGRPVGEPKQEVGGVTVTLAALTNAAEIDLEQAATVELARCWQNIDKIRAKHAAKPELIRVEL